MQSLQGCHDSLLDHVDALAMRLFTDGITLGDDTPGSTMDCETVSGITSVKAKVTRSLEQMFEQLKGSQTSLLCDANVQKLLEEEVRWTRKKRQLKKLMEKWDTQAPMAAKERVKVMDVLEVWSGGFE